MYKNFKNILPHANKLIEDLGIRRICTDLCKGKCCIPSDSQLECKQKGFDYNSCRHHLPCVLYTCGDLRWAIKYLIDNNTFKLLNYNKGLAEQCYSSARKVENGVGYGNAFFTNYSYDDIKNIMFEEYDIELFSKDAINKIRKACDKIYKIMKGRSISIRDIIKVLNDETVKKSLEIKGNNVYSSYRSL